MDLFDQIISQELKESGLIYGGSKKSHFTLSLINDGSGKFHADRVKISPGRAGNAQTTLPVKRTRRSNTASAGRTGTTPSARSTRRPGKAWCCLIRVPSPSCSSRVAMPVTS